MPDRSAVIYLYDGSFEGLLCCVYESYYAKDNVGDIINENDDFQAAFYKYKGIYTEKNKADRVYKSIADKISTEAAELVTKAFLTCAPQKEMMILNFLREGYKHGSRILNMLTLDETARITKAVLYLEREAHKYKGFIRFSSAGKALYTAIEPQNNVLPLIADHFADRFKEEFFFINDKKRKIALVYRPYEYVIIPVEDWQMPETDRSEIEYRRLWKQFYDTIAIEGRYNPRCRMNLMPKRYWKHMTEFQVLLPTDGNKLPENRKKIEG